MKLHHLFLRLLEARYNAIHCLYCNEYINILWYIYDSHFMCTCDCKENAVVSGLMEELQK